MRALLEESERKSKRNRKNEEKEKKKKRVYNISEEKRGKRILLHVAKRAYCKKSGCIETGSSEAT